MRSRLAATASAGLGALTVGCASLSPSPAVHGVIWQPDFATLRPSGAWDRLGVRELLVQWTVVDDRSFLPGAPFPDMPAQPDWPRVAQQPWAAGVIVGLAGRYDEREARSRVAELAAASADLARAPMPFTVAGWYFPVEADPTWEGAVTMGPMLGALPRPLWVSVYDKGAIGPRAFAAWVDGWLPADVGVLFQDGVGEHVRSPRIARDYLRELQRRLGDRRAAMVAEAFRPRPGGGFRPATAGELRGQLAAYAGQRVYLFDGPHYVSDAVIEDLTRGRRR